MNAVDVLVDDSGRLGALAYLVPEGTTLAPGDAVTVPFGKVSRHGLVLGPAATPEKATREILCRLGQRIDPVDMRLAFEFAASHFASIAQVASRLSPSSGRNSSPIDTGPVILNERRNDPALPVPSRSAANRLYLRPPLLSPARLAALEAVRLSRTGQVLVLCPTVKLLEEVLSEFSSGATRLDSKARAGAWNGWRSGSVRIGVGTRSAAFYSAASLGGIVVVEEEHPGHVEASLPYTHARDVARRRADLHRCALTLISAAPTAAGMHGCKVLGFENAKRFWPKVSVVSRADLHPTQRALPPLARGILTKTALAVVTVAESFPARRVCSKCSDPRPCPGCQGYCAHRPDAPCGRCGSVGVRWIGWDRQRLRTQVPAGTPMTLQELTQAPKERRLVAFMNVDPLLNLASLTPAQDAVSVLVRAAEAAGEGGQLLLVTDQPDHPVLQGMLTRDLFDVAKGVWGHAKAAQLPPFARLLTVRSAQPTAPNVKSWPGRVLGPRRRAGEWEVLVVLSEQELDELRPRLDSLRRRGKIRLSLQ
jgi:primosomal protein N'